MATRKADWSLLREEYIPYPPFQRHLHGLPPKQKVIDWREEYIELEDLAYQEPGGLEARIIFETYKKQPIFRVIAGRFIGRIFLDKTLKTNKRNWETLH